MPKLASKVGVALFLSLLPFYIYAQIFTAWYFDGSANPSIGSGSITTKGGTTSGFNSSINVAGGTAFSNTNFPPQGTNSGTAGLEIAVSTAGKSGISISWIQRHSGSSSRYFKVLISTNGIDFTPFDLTSENSSATLLSPGPSNASNVITNDDVFEAIGEDTWHRRTVNLSAITSVNDNSNFKFRFVSVFEPNTSAYTATGIGRIYATTGTYRYDSLQISADATLPLHFISLHAQKISGGIQLQWKTAQEKNVQSFAIQHGTDGQDFKEIGQEPATNLSAGTYSIVHSKVNNGINFYRVIAIDKDGTRQISPVISYAFSPNKTKDGYIFPTVVHNNATVVIPCNLAVRGLIQIFNNNGKLAYSQQVTLQNGVNYFQLQLSHFPAGLYYLQLPNAEGLKTTSFIKD